MTKTISIVLVLASGLASVSLAEEGIWTTKTNMPTARYVLSSSLVDGKIYAIGGDAGSRASVVEAYDPVTDTWTRKANMPMGRGAGASSVVNGRIYVIGGRLGVNGGNISSVIEYDATTDTWATKANMMPTPRTWLSSSAVNGKIYAIGGALTYQGTALSTVEEYDPATDTWTSKADMPTPRTCLSTSAVNGKIYAIGGNLSNQWYRGLTTVEEYDPATDTWTRKADMPTGRTYFSTCAVNGKIYAIGGLITSANHVSQVEEYDPATDTWTRKADIPTPRSGLATSAVNGKIYAIGGWVGSSTILSTVEEYDPHPIVVDFNGDFKVDFEDFSILAQCWYHDQSPFVNHRVDCEDLAGLAEYWLVEFGLVAHWKLDETAAGIAHDSIGGKDGYGAPDLLWRPQGGKVSGALELDGIDDLLFTTFSLNPADTSFSVFAWVKGGAPAQVIISQSGGANWLMADASEGKLITQLKGTGRFDGPLSSQAVITDGDWRRVGLTWDGSNRILYVDGIEVAKDTQTGLAGSTGGLYFGAGKDLEPVTFFSGLIDDIRIYHRAIVP